MENLSNLTRGGQIQLNNVRMLFQVANKVFFICFGIFLISVPLFWCFFTKTPLREFYWIEQHFTAKFCHENKGWCNKKLDYSMANGKRFKLNPSEILSIPAVRNAPDRALYNLRKSALFGGGLFAFAMVLIVGYLIRRGSSHNKKALVKGARLLDAKDYKKELRKANLASDLTIGGVPMVKDAETQHILIHGSPGTGKTVCMNQILEQVRAKGQKAIVYDIKGAFVPAYYRPGKDIILNPLDERSPSWNLWKECKAISDYSAMAAAIVPSSSSSLDTFWTDAARIVLSNFAHKFANEPSIKVDKFLSRLFSSSVSTIESMLENTMSQHMINAASERLAYSVLSTLASKCSAMLYIKDEGRNNSFSIHDWVRAEDDSWLFVNSSVKHSEVVKSIISLWLDMAIQSLLSLNESRTRRLWFLFDEFARLQRLPSLETLLSMGRGYGACFVGAVQDINQLRDLYGDRGADSLVGSCGTKLFFASNSARTSEWASNELSKVETLEIIPTYTMGAHQMRDGQSLGQQKKNELLVLPCEILKQPKLKAYMTTMGVENITQLKFKPKDMPNNYPSVVERDLSNVSFELKFKVEKPVAEVVESEETKNEEGKEEEPE